MSASNANTGRTRPIRMASKPLSRTIRSVVWAILITLTGISWVAKGAWSERVSYRQLTLEKQQSELVIEANNLKRKLLQVSEFARVETTARQRLGMDFPATAPEIIWTETSVEQPLLGTMAFFSLIPREPPSIRRR